jgi:hypothetical protein
MVEYTMGNEDGSVRIPCKHVSSRVPEEKPKEM